MKINIKKWIASAIVCAMVLSLAGCGSNSGKTETSAETEASAETETSSVAETDVNSENQEEAADSGDAKLSSLPTMTVRLATIKKNYTDDEHTALESQVNKKFDLLGIVTYTETLDGDGNQIREYQDTAKGTWVTDQEYTYLDEDGNKTYVTASDGDADPASEYYFDENGNLTSIVYNENGDMVTYADADEYSGAVFKKIDGSTVRYYNETGKIIDMIHYTSDYTDPEKEIDYAEDNFCVSGKELETYVNISSKENARKIVTKYSCEPEYDDDGKLIREEHRLLSCTYSDGTEYEDDLDDNVLQEIIEYSYDENGVLREKRLTKYHSDTGSTLEGSTEISYDINGNVYSYDESGRFTGEVSFKAYSKPGVYDELDEDSVTYSSDDEEYVYTDVEVLADPLLIFYLKMVNQNTNEILPDAEFPAVTH